MKLYFPPKTDIPFLDVWLERLVKELEPYLINSPTFTGQATIPTIDLTGGQIAFPATAVPSADPNTLDDYQEYVAPNTACTGAVTTAVIWKAVKIGSQVTLTLPSTMGAGAVFTNFVYGVALPAEFRPAVNMSFTVSLQDNGAQLTACGIIYITASTGNITIYKEMTYSVNFTVTAQCGLFYATAVSWMV